MRNELARVKAKVALLDNLNTEHGRVLELHRCLIGDIAFSTSEPTVTFFPQEKQLAIDKFGVEGWQRELCGTKFAWRKIVGGVRISIHDAEEYDAFLAEIPAVHPDLASRREAGMSLLAGDVV
jgi:hypothetical protein